MKNSKISIMGCGWLGLPLAKTFITNGYNVKGTTTTEAKLNDLKSHGINPFLIQLKAHKVEGLITDFLEESETLIINIPPGLRSNKNKNHVAEIAQLIPYIEESSVKNVLYISSTSVFADNGTFPAILKHTTPNALSNSGKQLIKIENSLQNNTLFNTTVLRFSGLFGADRHPGKILSGRKNVANPKAPVNLIHRDDCINIITKVIEQKQWNTALNAAYPFHPTKEEYYSNYCKTHQLPLPQFDKNNPSKGKIIDGKNVAQLLSYNYKLSL